MYGLETIKRLNAAYAERANSAERTAKRDRRNAALAYAAMLEDERKITTFDLGIIEEYLGLPKDILGGLPLTPADYADIARHLRLHYENAE